MCWTSEFRSIYTWAASILNNGANLQASFSWFLRGFFFLTSFLQFSAFGCHSHSLSCYGPIVWLLTVDLSRTSKYIALIKKNTNSRRLSKENIQSGIWFKRLAVPLKTVIKGCMILPMCLLKETWAPIEGCNGKRFHRLVCATKHSSSGRNFPTVGSAPPSFQMLLSVKLVLSCKVHRINC